MLIELLRQAIEDPSKRTERIKRFQQFVWETSEPDDGLALEAARGLARLKVREAREAILVRFAERMAKRGQGEFRKMVEKVLARLER